MIAGISWSFSPGITGASMIPAGMPAKLVQVPDPEYEGFRVNEMADRLKFVEPSPVVVLLGAMGTRS